MSEKPLALQLHEHTQKHRCSQETRAENQRLREEYERESAKEKA